MMRCQTCGRDNEGEALFCVYCGIRIDTQPNYRPVQPAATGATIDLNRGNATKARQVQPEPQVAQQPLIPPTPIAPPQSRLQPSRSMINFLLWFVAIVVIHMLIFKSWPFWLPFVFIGVWFNSNRDSSCHIHSKDRNRRRI